ncbi:hypothetical protein KX729_02175 [Rhizobium sp. XQZ8]|uniref:hypothetical protein n=1 Tax=Rhizobium populisoli TaxID=2859785 RepID=UPI001CA56C1F|nr:hypothetical protein [Rhizobium populisoli]MBW6420237.1 hypothetical protein [Rhizobium populisoli]
MGDSKNYRRKFFSDHPVCCFCGGGRAIEEIEHIPPRFMFINKHRPSGFEFPTCIECNRASRKTDTVVSFLTKFASIQNLSEKYHSDFEATAKGLLRNCPETYDEILSGRFGNRQEEKRYKKTHNEDVVIVSLGPKQREHINLFGLKLTLAAYYLVSGNIASSDAYITIYIHTSKNLIENTIPQQLNFLGEFHTMQQGNWSVPDQFSYRYGSTDDKKNAVFQFLMHNNLLLSTFIFDGSADEKSRLKLNEHLTVGSLRAVNDVKRNPFPSISMSYEQT